MTAQADYVRNVITHLEAPDLAGLVAQPPGGRSQALGVKEIHEMVKTYGDPVTQVAWAVKLADAANRAPSEGWPATWSLPIAALIFDLPTEVPESPSADVVGIDRAA